MKKFVSVLLIIVFLMAFLYTPVFALAYFIPAKPTVLEVILSVFLQFGQLAGIGAVIAAFVNVLKEFKVVTDGTAGRWFAGFSLAAIALLVYLKLFQPQIAIEYIDAQAAILAQILLMVLGYVVQLGAGLFTHDVLAKLQIPWLGKSFSREKPVVSGG